MDLEEDRVKKKLGILVELMTVDEFEKFQIDSEKDLTLLEVCCGGDLL